MPPRKKSPPQSKFTKPALEILKLRYLKKDQEGNPTETPEDLLRRVAEGVARAEDTPNRQKHWARKFYQGMAERIFFPNSPTLLNCNYHEDGSNRGCLSACFQLTPEDDEEDILDTAKRMGMILKHGGGVGIALSKLRPEGSPIRSTHGKAHGPVLALREVFRAVPRMITQGGVRQAANLACLSSDHPDVDKFISCKTDHIPSDDDDPGMALYNISVDATNRFMKQKNKRDRALFKKIAHQAWKHGCPGLLFLERANEDNLLLADPTDKTDRYYAMGCNPCSEEILPHQGLCQLLSINIHRFWKDGSLDTKSLKETIKTAIRFLDDVVTVNTYPDEGIRDYALFSRDIGLGLMGLADIFIDAGWEYGSPESIEFCHTIGKLFRETAECYSKKLGKERGHAPAFLELDHLKGHRDARRNVALLAIAPTGTLSLLADCVNGCEPLFARVELRRQGGITFFHLPAPIKRLLEENPTVATKLPAILEDDSLTEDEKLKRADAVLSEAFPHVQTAHEIKWKDKLNVVAALQEHIDRGISHTLNLPADAPLEDAEQAFLYAHEVGLKGITIYRDGSIPMQPYTAASTGQHKDSVTPAGQLYDGPEVCESRRHKIQVDTGGKKENVYIHISLMPDTKAPFEVFVTSKVEDKENLVRQMITGLSRLVSTSLRAGAPLEEVVHQLEQIEGQYMYSIPLRLASILRQYTPKEKQQNSTKCPKCKESVRKEGGCESCPSCGWSKCS